MQLLISILVIGLLWMIYDVMNAPAVDEDENQISEEIVHIELPVQNEVMQPEELSATILEKKELDETI